MLNFKLICQNSWDFEVKCNEEHFFTVTSYIATLFQDIEIREYTIFYTKMKNKSVKILVRYKCSTLYHVLNSMNTCGTIKMKVDNYITSLTTCSVHAYLQGHSKENLYCYYLKTNGKIKARSETKEEYNIETMNTQYAKAYSKTSVDEYTPFCSYNLKILTNAKSAVKNECLTMSGIDAKLIYSHSPKNWGDVEHRYGKWSAVSTLETWGQVMTSKIA